MKDTIIHRITLYRTGLGAVPVVGKFPTHFVEAQPANAELFGNAAYAEAACASTVPGEHKIIVNKDIQLG